MRPSSLFFACALLALNKHSEAALFTGENEQQLESVSTGTTEIAESIVTEKEDVLPLEPDSRT
jgi:hypothetical protein